MKLLNLAPLVLFVSCAVPENGSREASHEGVAPIQEGSCAPGSQGCDSFQLIGANDFDNAFTLSKNNTSASLTGSYTNVANSNRNNTFNDVTVTWRKSTDPAATRKALNLFGGGTFVKSGLATNKATAKVTFKPNAAGVGEYYIYLKFTTVGEDQNTSIFKVTITN